MHMNMNQNNEWKNCDLQWGNERLDQGSAHMKIKNVSLRIVGVGMMQTLTLELLV